MKKQESVSDIKHVFPEVRVEHVPKEGKEFNIHISEAHRTPITHDKNKSSPRYIKNKEIQHKNRSLKAIGEKKQITYKGKPISITADFSTQTLQ